MNSPSTAPIIAATAYAHTNIALVKYWGKRADVDRALNLPAVGSLSLTLDRFGSETRVTPGTPEDRFTLDGNEASADESRKVFTFLDRVRGPHGPRAHVSSRNDVPTAAGLASSASGFAALAVAASRAFGHPLEDRALTQLARQGSGSAARSVHGGFVILHRGVRPDGADCFAEPLASALPDLRLVVVRCASGRKHTESTRGMDVTAETSPYFAPWVDTHAADLAAARAAVERGDLAALGEVMEHNTMKMHASALAARPWILYLNGATLAVLTEVRVLRERGLGAWATMDAGPHVKVLCAAADADNIKLHLVAVAGVVGVDICAPGPRARIVEA